MADKNFEPDIETSAQFLQARTALQIAKRGAPVVSRFSSCRAAGPVSR